MDEGLIGTLQQTEGRLAAALSRFLLAEFFRRPPAPSASCASRGSAGARSAKFRLTGVSRIEAVFGAHLRDERKILAASDQTDDG